MSQGMNMTRIAVLGDIIVDRYLMGRVHRISPEAPVPVLALDQERIVPGGAANVAANVAALGASVVLVGLVGADRAADELRGVLERQSISPAHLVIDSGRPTSIKTRVVSGVQQIVRIDDESVAVPDEATEQALMKAVVAAIETASLLVLSDYAKGTLSPAVLRCAMEAARRAGCPVLVDPKRRDFSVYRGATLLTPNRKELSDATGLPTDTDAEVATAGALAAAQFGGDLLVTRAEHGMTLIRRDAPPFHVPAEKRQVFDVSGAGDTAVAALAVALASRQPLETAVIMGNLAAGLSVGKLGTSVVTHDELMAALRLRGPSTEPAGALVTLPRAVEILAEWRVRGERVVLTNGCFDLIHPGHVSLLHQAARQGDRLVVALNSDASVKRLKGSGRPVQKERSRAQVLGAFRVVDLVVLFEDDTPLALIEALLPDVLVKGADYSEQQVVGADIVKARGGEVVLVPIVEGQSTTGLVAQAERRA